MSSGGGGGVGGSIPGSVRRTIQDIKEIARGHTDDEVYAMLRDCNMDPNETAQRLLLQDTFHEVKRKRDKRKEAYVYLLHNNSSMSLYHPSSVEHNRSKIRNCSLYVFE